MSGECVDWSVKSKPWTEDKSEKWCIQVSVLTRLHYNLSFLKLCQLEYIFDPAVVKGMILVWKSVTFSAITLTLDISNCQDLEDVASLLAASIYKFWPKRVRGLNILSLSLCVHSRMKAYRLECVLGNMACKEWWTFFNGDEC